MYISLPPSLLEHIDITRLFQGATKTKHCEIWLLFPGSAAGAALKCVCVYIYIYDSFTQRENLKRYGHCVCAKPKEATLSLLQPCWLRGCAMSH